MEPRSLSGTSLDVNGARNFIYLLATTPVSRQHRIVPSLTPPKVPRPTMPIRAAMTTIVVSEATRTFP